MTLSNRLEEQKEQGIKAITTTSYTIQTVIWVQHCNKGFGVIVEIAAYSVYDYARNHGIMNVIEHPLPIFSKAVDNKKADFVCYQVTSIRGKIYFSKVHTHKVPEMG